MTDTQEPEEVGLALVRIVASVAMIIAWAVIAVFWVARISVDPYDPEPPAELHLTVAIYSGLPNPTFLLSAEESGRVRAAVDRLGADYSGTVSHPETLGFTAFHIEAHPWSGQPHYLTVSLEGVSVSPLDDDGHPTDRRIRLRDPDAVVFQLLRDIGGSHDSELRQGIPDLG